MAAELNGTVRRRMRKAERIAAEPAAGPVADPAAGVAAPRRNPQRKAAAAPAVKPWAYCGVGLTLGLSGWLNGLAFSASAPVPAHGWALGLAIPAGVLVFSRVAALLYAAGRRGLAYAGAVACLSMLLLSVQHVAVSIARLTGEPVGLAALMALAIDLGLVVCELATVTPRR